MDTDHYKTMANNILNDDKFYEQLPTDPKNMDRIKYNRFINKYKACLTEKELGYLQTFEVKSSNFYGLPKVHKSKQISDICQNSVSSYVEVPAVNDLKLRPIIAGPTCQTHRLSEFIDTLLKPYTKHVKSYLRDTNDFLNALPQSVPPDTLLVSFDVESLYSNIPHTLGLEAVKYWLGKFPGTLHSRFSNDFILDAIKLILENNTFYFNSQFYRQIKGTAMGTKFAPIYATLAIAYLEVALYHEVGIQFGDTFASYFVKYWKRFLMIALSHGLDPKSI